MELFIPMTLKKWKHQKFIISKVMELFIPMTLKKWKHQKFIIHKPAWMARVVCWARLDSFTAPLHSPNGRHLPAIRAVKVDCQWPLNNCGNSHHSYVPGIHCNWGISQPIFRPANYKRMIPAITHPTDSPTATSLWLCISLYSYLKPVQLYSGKASSRNGRASVNTRPDSAAMATICQLLSHSLCSWSAGVPPWPWAKVTQISPPSAITPQALQQWWKNYAMMKNYCNDEIITDTVNELIGYQDNCKNIIFKYKWLIHK